MMIKGIHPAAEMIPLPSDEDFKKLCDDIKANGQLVPIEVLPDGQLIDGRSRLRACEQLGLEPRTEVVNPPDPWIYSCSLNVSRRHLTPGQLAAIAHKMLPHFEELAKQRLKEAGGNHGNQYTKDKVPPSNNYSYSPNDKPTPPKGNSAKGKAKDQAAKAVGGISGMSVGRYGTVEKADPELAEKVAQGTISLNAAHSQVKPKKPKAEKPKPAPEPPPIFKEPDPVPEEPVPEKPAPPPAPGPRPPAPEPKPKKRAKLDKERMAQFEPRIQELVTTLPERPTKTSIENKVRTFLEEFLLDIANSFDIQVKREVDNKLNEQRKTLAELERKAKEEKARYDKLNENVIGLMTYEEFKVVRSCLHPDRAPRDEQEKFNRAFSIFNRLQESIHPATPKKILEEKGWGNFRK